jgi:hypothetical protein
MNKYWVNLLRCMEISQGANVLITTCRHQNAAVMAKNIRNK